MHKYHQGIYKIINKDKYKGDSTRIIFRSSWELKMFQWLDKNPAILWFSSEEFSINYINPIDNKVHRYFPDILACVKHKNGSESIYLLEIKPFKQTQPPKQKKKTKRFLSEYATYAINCQKWAAADKFCQEKNWIFKLITEHELGL